MRKIKVNKALILIIFLLITTRFVNLTWGFPYLFHPDERNIVISIAQLRCPNIFDLKNCFNPNFFAYGQFFLYLGKFISFWTRHLSFVDLTLILRSVSAILSIFTAIIGILIIKEITKNNNKIFSDKIILILSSLLFIFSPSLIQFAHFGTTESLLMFFYTTLIFGSLLFLNKKISVYKYAVVCAFIIGLSVATKVSSLIFLFLPFITFYFSKEILLYTKIRYLIHISFFSLLLAIFFSPHFVISYREFLSSLSYESNVALGKLKVFYTRQFEGTSPIIFQLFKIFPYSLGIPVFTSFVFGLFFLSKNRINNFLILSFLVYFIPTSFAFAKWTRFMAPVFPIIIIIATIFLLEFLSKRIKNSKLRLLLLTLIVAISIIPGIRFFSMYLKSDSRIEASKWIIKNIPSESVILSETANVVDIPVGNLKGKNYELISENLYEIDEDKNLYDEFLMNLKKTDYIIVPSRRIFANHKNSRYPKINKYYDELFSGKLGFRKVAEFRHLNDELAEETFSVFDHPVVKIYKRI